MNTLGHNHPTRSEVVSDTLQVVMGFWFWVVSLVMITPLIDTHPEWTTPHPEEGIYWVEATHSANSLKDQKLKLSGWRLGIRSL